MTTDLDPNLDRRLHESQDVTSQLADKLEPRLLRSSQMVKRAKTPEVPEPCKYYTCWKPYPENADFELDEDYIKFSRWIANILGQSGPLYALYYKPRVRISRIWFKMPSRCHQCSLSTIAGQCGDFRGGQDVSASRALTRRTSLEGISPESG